MSQTPRVGAHSCVVHPELKAVQPSLGGRYGRMFPNVPFCEVDVDSATLPSSEPRESCMADLVVFAGATVEPSP